MDSKVTQKIKIENHHSSINHTYTMLKVALLLITELGKLYGTTNCFHH